MNAQTTRRAMQQAMESAGNRRLIVHMPEGETPSHIEDQVATFRSDEYRVVQGQRLQGWDVYIPDQAARRAAGLSS